MRNLTMIVALVVSCLAEGCIHTAPDPRRKPLQASTKEFRAQIDALSKIRPEIVGCKRSLDLLDDSKVLGPLLSLGTEGGVIFMSAGSEYLNVNFFVAYQNQTQLDVYMGDVNGIETTYSVESDGSIADLMRSLRKGGEYKVEHQADGNSQSHDTCVYVKAFDANGARIFTSTRNILAKSLNTPEDVAFLQVDKLMERVDERPRLPPNQ